MRRLLRLISLCGACTLGLSLPAQAAPTAAKCGPYALAFYEHGVLYFRDTKDNYAGIDLDVVNELAKRSGCVFKTVLESRVRIWDQLSRNQLDLSVSGIPTPEREQYAEFMLYMQSHNYVVMRKGMSKQVGSLADFLADPKRQIVVVKSFKHGSTLDAWLDQLRSQQRVVEAPDFEAALRVFKAGRTDAMLALPTTWSLLTRREAVQQQFELLDWAPQDQILAGLIVSRQRVSEADRLHLRQALMAMRKDGTLDAIFKRHVGPDLAQSMRLDPALDSAR
ncbi:transporter substrate-binding domain-containing protein [Paucibacter sp. AS339]|uniref:substrate-binding periplasmic protein n=1 Tax=Paucibacter hankyongi TaxID=3133434 RepID=UPI00309AF987